MAAARKVLIVGGGPAGLSTAAVLGKRGVDVELVEINEDLRPLGSGLTMMGPSLRALKAVDEQALDDCVRQGAGHHAVGFANARGEIVSREALPQPAGPAYPGGFGIMRPLFWGLLAEAAQRAGTKLRLATTVEAIEQHDDVVDATFTDGSIGTYDLVVGCDGVHSKVRSLVFPEAKEPFFTGQTVWRAVVPRAPEMDDLVMFYGPRLKAGCNPVSDDEMYVFVVENTPEVTRPPRDQWPEMIQTLLSDFEGTVAWARERMTDPERIDRRPLQAILMPSPWYRGRVLLIGDAVHATTPHLAMGAGIAIEDAVVLGELLGHGDVLEALEAFMERRWERCRLVVENSLQLGEWEKRPGDPEAPAKLMNESFGALAQPF